MGAVLILATQFRIPTDYQLRASTIDQGQRQQLYDYRMMHIAGLLPASC